MAKSRDNRRLSSGFNLGGQQAEADPLLDDAFYSTATFRALNSRTDPNAFVVGRTGSGKSALLTRLEMEYPEHVIRLSPQDLSLPYISDSTIIRMLKTEGIHLDPLFIALWKHVLLVEVIRHRYGINSPEAKQNFISGLLDRIKRDHRKEEALKYLEDFQGRFWCEADVRVREITDSFEQKVSNAGNAGGSVLGGIELEASRGSERSTRSQIREEWASTMQRIVNETQLARLNQMIKVLDEDILESDQNYTYVVIDDLDLDWVDDVVLNDLIRCLFRAVLDLKRVRNLKVVVALRTNIFESLDFGARTGGQEEKFRALTLPVRWSSPDLEKMLNERVLVAAEQYGVEIESLKDLLPATNKTRGSALDYILRRTLMRPRDAIAYFNFALEASTNKPRLTWDRIHAVEGTYSRNRLLALRDEWKPTYPGIDGLLSLFTGVQVQLLRDAITTILDEIALLLADSNFQGKIWLTPLCSRFWDVGSHSWVEQYGSLVRLLFDIGLIGCGVENKPGLIYRYEEDDFIASDAALERVTVFSVHPAFRSALEIKS